jgi:hypothetical protein
MLAHCVLPYWLNSAELFQPRSKDWNQSRVTLAVCSGANTAHKKKMNTSVARKSLILLFLPAALTTYDAARIAREGACYEKTAAA